LTLHDFLSRLDGVKGYDGQYSARCPAHDDKRQSLSVSCGTDGRILLNCHAGCTPEEIVDAMGLKMKDLYQMEKPKKEVVAQYQYFDADGVPTVQKIRYSDKSFTWRRESAGDWIYNRQGVEPTLYTSTSDGTKSLPVDVFLVEGEKDVNTLKRLGKAAVSLPDGAQSKWYSNYADALQGRNITIIQDNDRPGKDFARRVAKELKGASASVKILDLTQALADLPEHGDTTDLIEKMGDAAGLEAIMGLAEKTAERKQKRSLPENLDMATMEQFLTENGIKVRQNVISHEIEISGIGGEYNPETIGSELHIILFDRLKKDFRCDKNLVADLLGVIAGKHRFNPVIDMLESITWDKKDRLNDLCGIIGIDPMDKLSKSLLAKWLCQCVAMAYNDPAEPYGADGLLVLQGPQGIGKTTFVSKLCMGRHDLYKLGQYLDTKDKDTSRRCTSAWVVELGEVETTLRSDLERLKAFITAERDEYRLPYGKADQVLTRRTSLIATCNTDRFLIDPTGSRRFWTVPINHIDLDALNRFDFLPLWAEVASWVKGNRQYFRLSREEQTELAERNTEHEKPLKAQLEVEDILEDATEDKQWFEWKYISVSTFKAQNDSLRGYSVEQIGKALDKIGIPAERKTVDGRQCRARRLPVRKWCQTQGISTGSTAAVRQKSTVLY